MIARNIFPVLSEALEKKQIIVLTGLRRVGKTTTVKYLFKKIKSSNKFYFDFERIEYRKLFSDDNYGNIISALQLEGVDFNRKAYLILDEIQLVQNITSVIKYIYDTYNVKFIITGSSSFYMKGQFSESLAGRKQIFELWPLSFDEFLRFKGAEVSLPAFLYKNTPLFFIEKLSSFYDEYSSFGGFPEVALVKKPDDKKALLQDIFESYVNFDIRFLSDFTKTDDLYKLIRLLSARVGSKVDYSKLSSLVGINRHKVKEYILFLEKTYFIRLLKPFVTNPDREIALQKKYYFTDSGLLNIMGQIGSGAVFENTIANQLFAKGSLQYYAKKNGKEIDFILDEKMAFEVKETPTLHDLKILRNRSLSIGIKQYYLVGKTLPGSGFKDFIWGGAIY